MGNISDDEKFVDELIAIRAKRGETYARQRFIRNSSRKIYESVR